MEVSRIMKTREEYEMDAKLARLRGLDDEDEEERR